MDLIKLLIDRVSPLILNGESTFLTEKANALAQFYPFLLSALRSKPAFISQLTDNLNPRISDLFGGHGDIQEQFVSALSESAPVQDIQLLLNKSIPATLNTLADEAGSSDPMVIQHFLDQHEQSITASLAPWASSLLGLIGLGSVAAPVAASLSQTVNTDVEQAPLAVNAAVEAEKKSVSGLWLALIALLILILLAFLFLRSCKTETPVTTAGPVSQVVPSVQDAAFALETDATGKLLNCQIKLADAGFVATLQQNIKSLFGQAPDCTADTGAAWATTLVDQAALPNVLKLLKGVPNLKFNWVGQTLTLEGADQATLQRLADQLKPLLNNVNIQINAATNTVLDEGAAVNNSIDQASKALQGIDANAVSPQDIVSALNLQIINFASGSDAIPDQNKAVLDQAATLLSKVPNVKLMINGYTDSVGNDQSNQVLSQKRAQAVADYLTSKGVDTAKLAVTGLGESNPVADNATKEGQFKNRRIEFNITQ